MIVGAWQWFPFEEAFSIGLEANGVEVEKFSTQPYFQGKSGAVIQSIPLPLPAIHRLNRDVVLRASGSSSNVVLFWRPTHIFPSTVRRLTSVGVICVSYNNDDPFGPKTHRRLPWHHRFLWYWYEKCLPEFQFNFFFREINRREALDLGVKHAQVMLPCFVPSKDRPLELRPDEKSKYETEVVFVGHYEPDGRENYIRDLVGAGIKVKIWGGKYWSKKVLGEAYSLLAPIVPALGEDYPKALNGANICLGFISKLNRDGYTYRCFEIPACGKLMLAERTEELSNLFRDGEEACLFSSREEFLAKVKWLVSHPRERERIARAGMRRVWQDGHDVVSRAKEFLTIITR